MKSSFFCVTSLSLQSSKFISKLKKTVKKKSVAKKKKAVRKSLIAKEGTYLGINYDSLGELYVLYWFEEMMTAGYIERIERAPSFVLTDGYKNIYTEQTKRGTSSRAKEQSILLPSSYTPEFKVYWNQYKYKDIVWILDSGTKFTKTFIGHVDEGGVYTLIEAKPDFDQGNMTRLFINNQKFMFTRHHLYVNLIKTDAFFEKTFVPEGYKTTSTGRKRVIKYNYRTLKDFLTCLG